MAHEIEFRLQQLPVPITQIPPDNAKDQYPVYSGRTIYEQLTISGMNRLPITMLEDRGCLGAVPSAPPPIPVKHTFNERLVSGGMAARWDEHKEWTFLANLIKVTKRKIVQQIFRDDDNSGVFFLIYTKMDEGWVAELFEESDSGATLSSVEDTPKVKIKDNELVVLPGDKGLLYPNQWQYQRLEEIRWSIRKETSDFALSLLLIGHISQNTTADVEALESGKRIAAIPSGGVQVQRVGDSRVVDQLAQEYKDIAIEYFRAMHLFDASKQPDRPVGIDLQLRLQPQVSYIENLRLEIELFYSMFPQPITIQWRTLTTLTPQDKQIALGNIETSRAAGYITADEAKALLWDLSAYYDDIEEEPKKTRETLNDVIDICLHIMENARELKNERPKEFGEILPTVNID